MYRLIWLVCFFFFFSCSENEHSKTIIGQWKGIQWESTDHSIAHDPSTVEFDFNSNGTYRYRYHSYSETGKYKVEHNMLFTTPEGGREMMVYIQKLNQDTLIFQMNRAGNTEHLSLVKQEQ